MYGATALHQVWDPVKGVKPADKAAVGARLLKAGADASARDIYGSTPLHSAAKQGNAAAATLLMKNGGQPELKDKAGKSPGDVAKDAKHAKLAALLRAAAKDGL